MSLFQAWRRAALCAAAALIAAMLLTEPARAQTSALAEFTQTINASIDGYNRERLDAVTPEACAAACRSEARRNWCVSFDYKRAEQQCDLSNARAAEAGGLKRTSAAALYDHYELKPEPLRGFVRTPDAAISGHNVEHLSGVSPSQCAAACTDPSRPWCRSFDHYKTQQRCDLSDKRASDIGGLKTDYAGNPFDHYALLAGEGVPNPTGGPQGRRHVLIIGIDGLRGDALFCDGCATTPGLAALANGGAHHRNVRAGGAQATISGPGWATQFTGYWGDQHGVYSNDTSQPMLRPHVLDRLKQAWPTATVAVVGDWFNIVHTLKPDGADVVVMNAAKNSQQATDAVKGWLSWKHAPTAIFYYLHNVDVHAPSYDPYSPYYQDKIAGEDAQIRQVLAALTARPTFAQEEWLIAVVSDHGGIGSGHGGQSVGERATPLILNNTYGQPSKVPYCRGDLTATAMPQVDALTPHVLDFFGLANPTIGRKHPACGR